jgi:hypothetical protein
MEDFFEGVEFSGLDSGIHVSGDRELMDVCAGLGAMHEYEAPDGSAPTLVFMKDDYCNENLREIQRYVVRD